MHLSNQKGNLCGSTKAVAARPGMGLVLPSGVNITRALKFLALVVEHRISHMSDLVFPYMNYSFFVMFLNRSMNLKVEGHP